MIIHVRQNKTSTNELDLLENRLPWWDSKKNLNKFEGKGIEERKTTKERLVNLKSEWWNSQ